MTVRAPRSKKPEMVDEVVRTLQAYNLLVDGVAQRYGGLTIASDVIALLAIAERIAARTSEAE